MKIVDTTLQQTSAHREESRTDLAHESRITAVSGGLFGALMAQARSGAAPGSSDTVSNVASASGSGDSSAPPLPPGFLAIDWNALSSEAPSQTDHLRLQKTLERLLADLLAILRGEPADGSAPLSLSDLLPATKAVSDGAADTDPAVAASNRRPAVAVTWQSTTTTAHYESEAVSYCAKGQVCTADGRQIDVSLDFALARESLAVSRVEQSGKAYYFKDPLVVSLPGGTANLDGPGLSFDLDADGTAEAIPFTGRGSALLAWDRNGNGSIDDGRELFGALSGDGFADLAALDSDHNGWIDEADPVWSHLVLWQRQMTEAAAPSSTSSASAAGTPPAVTDRLISLKEAGIGALSVSGVSTPFLYKRQQDDGSSDVQGMLRASGVYLMEDGRPGALQQVDLAV
ncbi:hypothetical protein OTERR_00310 [Oryzomicrobium terrae]|uniref:VCBS repeat-containing protein n=1 Tax=Oryzomicrobium terrae TaxID=1735038 RepID=A0A5C1E5F3_9RHOO|nr:hypothetical protein [Oryzomicrobium terrae]QEL63507.1 hypothetical protein OTERR_00310 [Oryzomicrobium terrae]